MNAIELTSKGCISKSSTKHSLHNNLIIASNKHLLKSAIKSQTMLRSYCNSSFGGSN